MLEIWNFLLDLIFPKFCVGCAKEGDWVCCECQKAILPVKTQVCPLCGRISPNGKYCPNHQKPHGLSGIIVAAYYEEGPVKELIHNFKYNHILEIKEILGGLMTKALKENVSFFRDRGKMTPPLLVTAVPLHFWRRSQRGYNQSELLADEVYEKFLAESQGFKLQKNFKILKKIRKTKPQVKFSGKKRRKNLIKSFEINKNFNILGRTIILVDDVTTTGTTLNECAKVLRKAGARRVWGLVVAKG